MVVLAWGDAALHARGRLVAEHGRVRPAHPRATGARRPASQGCSTGHRLVGTDRGGMEHESYRLCVEWQTSTAPGAGSFTPVRWVCRLPRERIFNCELT